MLSYIIKDLARYLKLTIFKKKWRKYNKNNYTIANTIFPIDKVKVGYKTYGKLDISCYGNPIEKLTIGSYCSIANNVKFILGGEHHNNYVSNYLFKFFINPNDDIDDRKSKGEIFIGDDVWIGTNVTILSGVNIGQGAVIAAGSVVNKDVPPYAIYTTNKIIKYRFSKDIIDMLLKVDFNRIDFNFVQKNMDIFYSEDIENFIRVYNEKIV